MSNENLNKFFQACQKGDLKMALDYMPDESCINAREGGGRTGLTIAVIYRHHDVVNMLLHEKGVDIDARDNDNCSALIHAIANVDVKMVKSLLKSGADWKLDAFKVGTPMYYAETVKSFRPDKSQQVNEIIRLLKGKGAKNSDDYKSFCWGESGKD